MKPRLPMQEAIEKGTRELNGRKKPEETLEALLVSIGSPKLRSLGVRIRKTISNPEHKLYDVLARQHGDNAHSAYNALIRLLVSYERALPFFMPKTKVKKKTK